MVLEQDNHIKKKKKPKHKPYTFQKNLNLK